VLSAQLSQVFELLL